jgi:hypothetical protein
LEGFKELLAVDSTVLNLHDLLAPSWEATNEGRAAAKMHVIANATTGGPNSVKFTDQRTHERPSSKDHIVRGLIAVFAVFAVA